MINNNDNTFYIKKETLEKICKFNNYKEKDKYNKDILKINIKKFMDNIFSLKINIITCINGEKKYKSNFFKYFEIFEFNDIIENNNIENTCIFVSFLKFKKIIKDCKYNVVFKNDLEKNKLIIKHCDAYYNIDYTIFDSEIEKNIVNGIIENILNENNENSFKINANNLIKSIDKVKNVILKNNDDDGIKQLFRNLKGLNLEIFKNNEDENKYLLNMVATNREALSIYNEIDITSEEKPILNVVIDNYHIENLKYFLKNCKDFVFIKKNNRTLLFLDENNNKYNIFFYDNRDFVEWRKIIPINFEKSYTIKIANINVKSLKEFLEKIKKNKSKYDYKNKICLTFLKNNITIGNCVYNYKIEAKSNFEYFEYELNITLNLDNLIKIFNNIYCNKVDMMINKEYQQILLTCKDEIGIQVMIYDDNKL